jgi:hypothetical protein
MALFFNLELLESESNCDPKIMLQMLERHSGKKLIPKNHRDRNNYRSLVGHSFLLDANSLFNDPTDIAFKAQYIRLAGRRDYSLYKLYRVTYLDLTFFKDVDLNTIALNPLLDIKQNEIHFKYEN